MIGSRQNSVLNGRMAARTGCVAAALLLLAGAAAAQAPQNPAEPQAQPDAGATRPPAANSSGYRPGFIDAFGDWIGSSVSNWNSGLKGAADAAKGAAGVATDAAKGAAGVASDAAAGAANVATTVTRDTAGAVVRFPGTRVIAERATCPTAPNGAPDCRAAAETICKAHGFASGSSIDFQTAEKCPPIALNRSADAPPPCVIESYVTRALCQ